MADLHDGTGKPEGASSPETSQATTNSPDLPFPLLELPAELRNRVYSFYLGHFYDGLPLEISMPEEDHRYEPSVRTIETPPLFQANRQIYNESWPVVFAHATPLVEVDDDVT